MNCIAIRFTYVVLMLIGLHSCINQGQSGVIELDTPSDDEDVVEISPRQFAAGQMELGQLTPRDFNTVVKANGMLAVPPQNQAEVSAYFTGYVKNLTLLPGDYVKKGQVLFTIENPDYLQIQQDFLEIKGQLSYLKSNFERQKELIIDNATSEKNLLKAESEYRVSLSRFQALEKKLTLMNIDPNALTGEELTAVLKVFSPISGYITSIEAGRGMFLNPSDVAMTIVNTNNLHIELKIFEKDLLKVKRGQEIRFRLQNDTQKVYKGKVHLINKTVNSQTRTVDIHGDLLGDEDVKNFVPGMYIEGEILTEQSERLALPEEAIADIDNDFFVLVKENDTIFRRRLVETRLGSEGYVEVLNADDFEEGSEFLIKGGYNLIVE
ncbi:efflux RND transporter periplasmic adaptor subunit [Membranihabitans marinus]|uniref:efflux RND transporter periplasmic adaptor subunit n=1 Tax=Membranihabitans marinus TaxID=1227546 RepID=UPI001EFFE4CD|nr:efflux RND transporter periplasmic adaptor subunit [Membranihabitans marinus]